MDVAKNTTPGTHALAVTSSSASGDAAFSQKEGDDGANTDIQMQQVMIAMMTRCSVLPNPTTRIFAKSSPPYWYKGRSPIVQQG